MTIVHIVLLEFKPTIHEKAVEETCKRLLGLKDKCIHPTTKKPYILHSVGGRDNSPEGHQVGGYSHGFVLHFESREDRRYYLEEDPEHLAFIKSLVDVVQHRRIVDFEPGVL